MSDDKLDELVRIGQLKAEPFSKPEFDGLIRSGKVRLNDAKNESLSRASRFDLAYNASPVIPDRRSLIRNPCRVKWL